MYGVLLTYDENARESIRTVRRHLTMNRRTRSISILDGGTIDAAVGIAFGYVPFGTGISIVIGMAAGAALSMAIASIRR